MTERRIYEGMVGVYSLIIYLGAGHDAEWASEEIVEGGGTGGTAD